MRKFLIYTGPKAGVSPPGRAKGDESGGPGPDEWRLTCRGLRGIIRGGA